MSDIQIEKGVPVPKARTPMKYPFEKMEVGDSFFVPKSQGNVSSAAVYWQKRHKGRRFVTRAENGGARCWRVA